MAVLTPQGDNELNLRSQVLVLMQFLLRHFYIPLILFILLRLVTRRYFSPLRSYPGPFLASISRLWRVASVARGRTEHEFIDLHRKYGPVVRIAPNALSIASPNAAREVLSAGKGFHKSDFYSVFPPAENPDIFTEIRENVHAQKKRVVAMPYSMATMQSAQSQRIEGVIALLRQKLDEFAAGPNREARKVNLGDWLHYFAFDVIGEVAFSHTFGFLEKGYDVDGCIGAIDTFQWYNGIIANIPFAHSFLLNNPILQYIPALSPKNFLLTKIAMGEMGRRKPFSRDREQPNDLLGMLIKGHEKTPEKFGEGDVFAVAHGAM
jgi:Cytochrome P450